MSEIKRIKQEESVLQPNKLMDLKNRFFQERDRYIRILLNDSEFQIPPEYQPQSIFEDVLSSLDIKSLLPKSEDDFDTGFNKMQIARLLLGALPKLQKAININSIPIHVSTLPKVKTLRDLSDVIGLSSVDLWIIGSTRGQYTNLADYLKANVFNLIPTFISKFLTL